MQASFTEPSVDKRQSDKMLQMQIELEHKGSTNYQKNASRFPLLGSTLMTLRERGLTLLAGCWLLATDIALSHFYLLFLSHLTLLVLFLFSLVSCLSDSGEREAGGPMFGVSIA